MTDHPTETGRLGPPAFPLIVGVKDGAVTIGGPAAWWTLDAQAREDFSRLYFEAIRQAEGDPAAGTVAQHQATMAEATRLLEAAHNLRMNASSRSLEWRQWDREAERFLRARGDGHA